MLAGSALRISRNSCASKLVALVAVTVRDIHRQPVTELRLAGRHVLPVIEPGAQWLEYAVPVIIVLTVLQARILPGGYQPLVELLVDGHACSLIQSLTIISAADTGHGSEYFAYNRATLRSINSTLGSGMSFG